MTAYVLTGNCNIDQLGQLSPSGSASARTGNDTVTTNGFDFTIDQDSRGGLTGGDTFSFGNMIISSASGGDIRIDGTGVWLIPYTGGSGNVPAWNTAITQSGQSGSGKLIAVYANLVSASVATGAAMPASGFIKVKQKTGIYVSGALTGISASASDAGRYGWIDVVGEDNSGLSAARLGTIDFRGEWYDIGVTDGSRSTTYNVPNNGKQLWVPSIWVQGASWSITGATWSGGIATYTAAGHDMLVGELVTITGASASGYNVTDQFITDLTDDTFSVAIASNPGAWTSGGTAIAYECWPCAGTLAATDVNVVPENTRRGKMFWNTNETTSLALPKGYLRFGHDGTNSTGGYCPPSGRKIRIGNVFLNNCTAADRGQNCLPNVTLATRYDFTTTNAPIVFLDRISCNWYISSTQAFSFTALNSGFMSQLQVSECGSRVIHRNLCIGQEAATVGVPGFTGTANVEGILQENVVATMAATSSTTGHTPVYHESSIGIDCIDCVGWMFGARTSPSKYWQFATCENVRVIRPHVIALRLNPSRSSNFLVKDMRYTDSTGLRSSANVSTPFQLSGPLNNVVFDGFKYVGYRAQNWDQLISVTSGRTPITVRNIGTPTSPLETGDGPYWDLSWSRTTTTCTVTHTAHGFITGDAIDVFQTTSGSAVGLGAKTVTVVDANTFTFTCANSGDASGGLSYMFSPCANAFAGVGTDTFGFKMQRCYPKFLRSHLITGSNSSSDITVENSFGTFVPATTLGLSNLLPSSSVAKMGGSPGGEAAAATYGTNWLDGVFLPIPDTLSATWSKATSTVTIELGSGNHINSGSNTGWYLSVTSSSDEAGLNLGPNTPLSFNTSGPTSTQIKTNAGVSAGSSSGNTCTFEVETGRILVLMNEASPASVQYSMTGTAAFTGGGTIILPAIGDSITFESPYWIRGHTKFLDAPPIFYSGTPANYNVEYDLDKGSGFSGAWKTLSRRTGANCTVNAGNTVTVPGDSTANWIVNGDRIWDAGSGTTNRGGVVSSGGGSTTLTLSKTNNGSSGGRVLEVFNLPLDNSGIDWETGFRMRVRITALVTNTAALGAIGIRTVMTAASRAFQLPLETLPLTVTVKDANTLAAIEDAHVYLYKVSDKSMILSGATNVGGVVTTTADIAVGTDIAGWVRQQDLSGVDYEPRNVIGTVTATGFETTILLTPN